MSALKYSKAIRLALTDEMERDPSIFVAGEDVTWGGAIAQYWALADRFPGRVLDTPISETAMAGVGLGAALMGMRPVIEYNLMDFTLVAMDELCNGAAKARFMGPGAPGDTKVPLTLLCGVGAGAGTAAQHSQSLETLFCAMPGLRVVFPSNAADAAGLLRSSLASDDPTLFIYHHALRATTCEVPDDLPAVPLGKARVARAGTDVTVVSWGLTETYAEAAADALAPEDLSVEVLDLRTLVPWDVDAVLASVRKTGRLVVAHEAVKQGGFGAEVAATVAEQAFGALKAPIRRLGAPASPVPYAPSLKQGYFVSARDIAEACRRVMG